MTDKDKATAVQPGFGELPKRLRPAVQIVSTFGLAVFLVMYYVLWMQPAEAQRYNDLRDSVNAMLEVLEEERSVLCWSSDSCATPDCS